MVFVGRYINDCFLLLISKPKMSQNVTFLFKRMHKTQNVCIFAGSTANMSTATMHSHHPENPNTF